MAGQPPEKRRRLSAAEQDVVDVLLTLSEQKGPAASGSAPLPQMQSTASGAPLPPFDPNIPGPSNVDLEWRRNQPSTSYDVGSESTTSGSTKESSPSEDPSTESSRDQESNPSSTGTQSSGGIVLCVRCGEYFESRKLLRRHVRFVHKGEKSFNCPSCDRPFGKKFRLKMHILKDHPSEEPWNWCSECDESFASEGDLLRHTDAHPFKCDKCSKSFPTQASRERHRCAESKGKKPFPCTWCPKSFRTRDQLKKHYIWHSDKKPFSCSECGANFKRKDHLVRHEKTHTREKLFKCTLCFESLPSKEKLIEHQLECFRCPICGKAFKQSYALSEHLRTHDCDRPFKCSRCEKSFKTRANLRTHLFIHSGERPFTCSICNRSFKFRNRLSIHAATHSNKTPFKCSKCDQSFKRKRSLEFHEYNHLSRLICSICGSFFHTEEELRAHAVVHRTGRCYSCLTCGAVFSRRRRLKMHVKSHAGPKGRFNCLECGMSFARKCDLNSHTFRKCRDPTERQPSAACGKAPQSEEGSTSSTDQAARTAGPSEFDKDRPSTSRQTGDGTDSGKGKLPSEGASGQSAKPTKPREVETRLSTPRQIFECSECGLAFASERHLLRHSDVHKKRKVFRCPECCNAFGSQLALSEHVAEHKGREESSSPDVPKICTQGVESEKSGQMPQIEGQGASGSRPGTSGLQPEPVAGTSGTSRPDPKSVRRLKKPTEARSKKGSFRCPTCGKQFKEKSDLKKHSLVHSDDRPFKCPKCGKVFKRHFELKKHMSTHTD